MIKKFSYLTALLFSFAFACGAPTLAQQLTISPPGNVVTYLPCISGDSSASFNAAAAALPGVGGRIQLGNCAYTIISGWSSAGRSIDVRGNGRQGTYINYTPTANGTAIDLSGSGSESSFISLSDLTIYGTEGTFTKVALKICSASEVKVSNVYIGGAVTVGMASQFSGGTGSTGMQLCGYQSNSFEKMYIVADKPVVFAADPLQSATCGPADSFSFRDMAYITYSSFPIITINSGVAVANLTMDGEQSWVGGTAGIQYVDTTMGAGCGAPSAWTFRNVRSEQGVSATDYTFDIRPRSTKGLTTLTLENPIMDSARNGIRLTYTSMVTMIGPQYLNNSGGTGVNVDATVNSMCWYGAFWLTGSVATLTGQTVAWALPAFPANAIGGTSACLKSTTDLAAGSILSIGLPITLTSNNASAFAVGRLGATTPAFLVDASAATSITGIKITSAATGGGVALSAIGEAANGGIKIDAQGSGTITIAGTSTGAITLSRATGVTGALTVSAGASITSAGTGVALTLPDGGGDNIFAMQSNGGNQTFSIRMASGAPFINSQNSATLAFGVSASATVGTSVNNMAILASGGVTIGSASDPGAGGLQVNAKMFAPNLPTTTAALGAALCWTTTTGEFQRDTNAGGCLVSAAKSKHDFEVLLPKESFVTVMAAKPYSFLYNDNEELGRQVGFKADDFAGLDERLIGRDKYGEVLSFRYQQYTATLTGALQHMNDNFEARLQALEARGR